jgi:hypothetical protein
MLLMQFDGTGSRLGTKRVDRTEAHRAGRIGFYRRYPDDVLDCDLISADSQLDEARSFAQFIWKLLGDRFSLVY